MITRVRRQHLNLDKALDKSGEIPDLNLGDLGKFRWWRFCGLLAADQSSLKVELAAPPPQSQRGAGVLDSDG